MIQRLSVRKHDLVREIPMGLSLSTMIASASVTYDASESDYALVLPLRIGLPTRYACRWLLLRPMRLWIVLRCLFSCWIGFG